MGYDTVFWIIEQDTFPQMETDKMKSCLTNMDLDFVEVEGTLAGRQYIDGEITWDDKYRFRPAVFWGSLGLARWIQNHSLRSDSVICNFPAFDCINYYPHYYTSLLNADSYIILPLSEAISHEELIFDNFASPKGTIFIRPNSGAKEFSGRVLTKGNLTLQSVDHGIYFDDVTLLVLIAPAKKILSEYRFFVTNNNKIITSSLAAPIQAYNFIRERVFKDLVTGKEAPDEVYVIDVCEWEKFGQREYAVIELNSASCSGIYDCDPKKLILTMNEVVEKRWKELYD